MNQILKFPKGFLWGSATSAYQVEGGIENSDWSKVYPAGKACDHYNLYEQDFDLLKRLNQNAYRFSIEWSRIEPEEGKFNREEIEHYQKFLSALKSRDIKTMVTLHHFTSPSWLVKMGSWENPKVVFYFSRFAERMLNEYHDLVDFWVTINEPLVYSSVIYLEGRWPPIKKNFISFLEVIRNQILAHKTVYQLFHKLVKNIEIGNVENYCFFEPFDKRSILDKFSAKAARYLWNNFYLNRIKNYLDFIGANYYRHQKIRFPLQKIEDQIFVSDINWEIYPKGILFVLKDLKKYNLPIFVTENGLADVRDKYRKNFIKDHLFYIHKALEEGVDVRGYFHWSLMDNFEWDSGFDPRFGLLEIDYKTLERKIRPSANFYAEICKNNQLVIP
jgi:beta-glucosidase